MEKDAVCIGTNEYKYLLKCEAVIDKMFREAYISHIDDKRVMFLAERAVEEYFPQRYYELRDRISKTGEERGNVQML